MENFNELRESTEKLKRSAFDFMVKAWECFDDAVEAKDERQYHRIPEKLLTAVEYGTKSLCVLYSGNADANAELGILRHLIQSRHTCFKTCNYEFIKHYKYWKDEPSDILSNKRLPSSLKAFISEVENVLQAIESYSFYLKRKVYFTKEEDEALNRKKRILVSTCCILVVLSVFVIYPVYHYIKPIRIYQTLGQFFWTSHSDPIENEMNSLRFDVMCDGEFHNYVLDTKQPIDLIDLRFDPIMESKVRVWIDYIELHRENQHPLIFNFNSEKEMLMSYSDLKSIKIENGKLYFETTGRDPILRMADLNINKLIKIKIRMKVLFEKTFLQWIFS